MKRAEILDAARACVCGERELDYGKPEDNFERIAKLWNAYRDDSFTPKDVAIMMALLKVARIRGGHKDDNFVDLAGYAACAGELDDAGEANGFNCSNCKWQYLGVFADPCRSCEYGGRFGKRENKWEPKDGGGSDDE